MIILEINITVERNKHDIQSNKILIGRLNDMMLTNGISIEMNIFFINNKVDNIKGIIEYIIIT